MTQPPNYPGDQGGFPPPQDPNQPGGYQPGGYQPQGDPQGGQGYPQQGGQGFPPPPSGPGFPPPPGGGYPPPQGGYGDPKYGDPQHGDPQHGGPQYGWPRYGDPQYGNQQYGNAQYGNQQYGIPQYGGLPGGQQPFSIGDAFSWAWNKFSKNAVALIVATLAYAVILGVLGGVFGFAVAFTFSDVETVSTSTGYATTAQPGAGTYVVVLLGLMVFLVAAFLMQAAFLAGLLDIADGREVTVASFFQPRNFGGAAVAAILVGLAVAVGYALCVIPGIVAAFLLAYAMHFAVDKGISGPDALKASFQTVKANAGNSILATLLSGLVTSLGAALCYVGALVTGPFGMLVQVYAYRRLSGGHVAPLTP